MRPTLLVCCAIALLAASIGVQASGSPKHAPMNATYTLYSGSPDDRQPPTSRDRKIAITVSGKAARDIFDSIGPDADVTCTTTPGERLRAKGEIWCSFRPTSGYQCYLGFDLRTGEPNAGTSC